MLVVFLKQLYRLNLLEDLTIKGEVGVLWDAIIFDIIDSFSIFSSYSNLCNVDNPLIILSPINHLR